jgi:hypothetical protein
VLSKRSSRDASHRSGSYRLEKIFAELFQIDGMLSEAPWVGRELLLSGIVESGVQRFAACCSFNNTALCLSIDLTLGISLDHHYTPLIIAPAI